jgi:hypothetical protein
MTAENTMTTATATAQDLEHLMTLLDELDAAGRVEEAKSVARAYAALSVEVYPELLDLPDDDPEFVRDMEEAEQDFVEGRWSTHEEVMRRLRAVDDT